MIVTLDGSNCTIQHCNAALNSSALVEHLFRVAGLIVSECVGFNVPLDT